MAGKAPTERLDITPAMGRVLQHNITIFAFISLMTFHGYSRKRAIKVWKGKKAIYVSELAIVSGYLGKPPSELLKLAIKATEVRS